MAYTCKYANLLRENFCTLTDRERQSHGFRAAPTTASKVVKIFFIFGVWGAQNFLLKGRKFLRLCFFAGAKAKPLPTHGRFRGVIAYLDKLIARKGQNEKARVDAIATSQIGDGDLSRYFSFIVSCMRVSSPFNISTHAALFFPANATCFAL